MTKSQARATFQRPHTDNSFPTGLIAERIVPGIQAIERCSLDRGYLRKAYYVPSQRYLQQWNLKRVSLPSFNITQRVCILSAVCRARREERKFHSLSLISPRLNFSRGSVSYAAPRKPKAQPSCSRRGTHRAAIAVAAMGAWGYGHLCTSCV